MVNVPLHQQLILASAHQLFPVWRECHGHNSRVMVSVECSQFSTGRNRPAFNGLILTCARQRPTVRTKREVTDPFCVASKRRQFAAGGGVPQFDLTVAAAGGDGATVACERHSIRNESPISRRNELSQFLAG